MVVVVLVRQAMLLLSSQVRLGGGGVVAMIVLGYKLLKTGPKEALRCVFPSGDRLWLVISACVIGRPYILVYTTTYPGTLANRGLEGLFLARDVRVMMMPWLGLESGQSTYFRSFCSVSNSICCWQRSRCRAREDLGKYCMYILNVGMQMA